MSSPIEPVATMVTTVTETASDVTSAATKAVAVSAIATIQLGRNLIDSIEGLAELGIDLTADTLDSVLQKLQEHVTKIAG